MVLRLLALIGLPILAYYFVRDISRRYSLTPLQTRYLYFFTLALLIVGILIALGRLPVQFLLAPLGVAVTFLLRMLPTLLRLLPMWQWFRSRAQASKPKSGGQGSSIRTAFLAMTLDHDSGAMDGEVLQGQFSGQQLSTLSLEQLLSLYRECAADADSRQVLEAYLDRQHQDWRQQAGAHSAGDEQASVAAAEEMTRAMALEILGLQEGATRSQVVDSHRRLMRQLHPDRGGSDYFAKKINLAKDFLLDSLNQSRD